MATERQKEGAEEKPVQHEPVKQPLFSPLGLIIVVIILAIVAILAFGIATFLQQKQVEVEVKPTTQVTSVKLGEIVVKFNRSPTGEDEIFKIEVELYLSKNAKAEDKANLESRKAQLRNIIIDLVYNVGYETLKRPNAVGEFKRLIIERLKKELANDIIESVEYNSYMPL